MALFRSSKLVRFMGCAVLVVGNGLNVSAAIAATSSVKTIPSRAPGLLDGVWNQIPNGDKNIFGRLIDGAHEPMAPDDGSPIPFQPWSAAIHAGALRALREQVEWSPNNQRCLVAGTVRALLGIFPWRLIETPQQITLLFEEDNRANIFRFANEHDKNLKATWTGDGIARWDGDTLVLDVTGFNGKTPFPLAILHTMLLHVTHRLHLLPDHKTLEDRMTIDDPGAFTQPFDIVEHFGQLSDDYELLDYRCAENNEDLPKALPFWPVDWGPE